MDVTWRDKTDADTYAKTALERVFNSRRPPHLPRAVVRVFGVNDVVSGVAIAIQEQCRLAIRCGGHSLPVWSLQEDSILLDLGEWKEVNVDVPSARATVTPGVTSKELHDALAPRGFAFPGGHCPDVGLGGFLLQGGMGWNFQGWGWGCEFVEAVQVVTTQGELLWCSKEQPSDLYWAARGAGPAFPAIVVSYGLRLMPSTPQGKLSSTYTYPRHCYRSAFKWALSVMSIAGANTEIKVLAYYDSTQQICLLVNFITTQTTAEEAQGILAEIHKTRPPGFLSESVLQPESLEHLYALQSAANSPEYRYCSDNAFLADGADVVSLLEPAFLSLPHHRSFAFWSPMVPRSRMPLDDMALSIRSDNYVALYAVWEDAQDDASCREWAHGFVRSIDAQSVGSYIGEADPAMRPGRFWTEDCARRLKEVQRRWDPRGCLSGCLAIPAE